MWLSQMLSTVPTLAPSQLPCGVTCVSIRSRMPISMMMPSSSGRLLTCSLVMVWGGGVMPQAYHSTARTWHPKYANHKFGRSGWLSRHQGSRLERDAQGHVFTIDDKDVSGTALGIANLAHGEAPPEERMGGVGDLNLGHTIFRWVLDGGSKLWARSSVSTTNCSCALSERKSTITGFCGCSRTCSRLGIWRIGAGMPH